jgi:TonB family protein
MTCKAVTFGKFAIAALFLLALGAAAPSSRAQEARKVINNPQAPYPEVARRLRLSGVVKVQVLIGTDGTIKEVKLIGGHPIFVNSVEETLKSWKYAPASTETRTNLEFNFQP